MTIHSRSLLFLIIVTLLPCLSLAQWQNKADSGDDFPSKVYRKTLVKENTSYQNIKRLLQSLATKKQVSNTPLSLGFQVSNLSSAKQRETEKIIHQFCRLLRENRGINIFYYASYVVQFENENYLLPTDIKLTHI